MGILRKIEMWSVKIETFLLVFMVLSICMLALMQVILRNFFSFGLLWIDNIIRLSVLWMGIIGASIATSYEKHLSIDIFSRYIPYPYNKYLKSFIDIIAIAVCVILFYASIGYVNMEREAQELIQGTNIPLWIGIIIFPLGMGLITLKFIAKFLQNIEKNRNGEDKWSII